MSSDAKVWQLENGHWRAVHDGACIDTNHDQYEWQLPELLSSVEQCLKSELCWTIRTYPGGLTGLVGYGYWRSREGPTDKEAEETKDE
jgi:hypothetical protein